MTGIEITITGIIATIIGLFVAPDKVALLGMIMGMIFALFLGAAFAAYLMGWG